MLWAIAILVDLVSCVKACCYQLTALFLILCQRARSNIRKLDAVSFGRHSEKFSGLIGPLDAERGPTVPMFQRLIRALNRVREGPGPIKAARKSPSVSFASCSKRSCSPHELNDLST